MSIGKELPNMAKVHTRPTHEPIQPYRYYIDIIIAGCTYRSWYEGEDAARVFMGLLATNGAVGAGMLFDTDTHKIIGRFPEAI